MTTLSTLTPADVLDREFLTARCQLIEVAAMLDRFDRAGDATLDAAHTDQLKRLRDALALLAAEPDAPADSRCGGAGRAEALLLLFSDDRFNA